MRYILFTFTAILTICAQLSPAADKKLKVHILGDSITQSKRQNYCWRYWVWLRLKDNGLDNMVDFVGSSSGPGKDWDCQHDAHWGWSSKKILKGLKGWAPRFKGDIVLVHLGTNDMGEPDITKIVDGYREIVSVLRANNESVRVVVGQIPSWKTSRDEKVAAFNKELLTLKALSTKGSPIQIVDLSQGYDRLADNYDGGHPNESGAKKYAKVFYPALVDMINYNPSTPTSPPISRIQKTPVTRVTCQWYYQLNGQLFIRIPSSLEKRPVFLNLQGRRKNPDEYLPR